MKILSSFVLGLLIIFSIFESFHLLSIEMSFILKLISVMLFCYLFYKLSTSYLIFGSKYKPMDIFILIGYLSLSIKNIIDLVPKNFEQFSTISLFQDLFKFILEYSNKIQYSGMIIGTIIILLASAYFCFVKIGKNSLMHLIKEYKRLRGADIFIRFIVSFIVLLTFYIIVFNLAIEWLVLIIHGPLLIIIIFTYMLLSLNRKRFQPNNFFRKVHESLEKVYEKIIRMFHTKRILLAVSFFLVLHLLSDFFFFIIPYLTGHFSTNYLASTQQTTYTPIITLFLKDLTISNPISVTLIYLFNLIAISVVLLTPFYLWMKIFRNKKSNFPKWCLPLSYSSLFVLLAMPLFRISRLEKTYAGVDIITQRIHNFNLANIICVLALIILITIYLLNQNNTFYKIANLGLTIFILIFIFIYVYNYFISISSYYLLGIANFKDIFIRIIFFIFFVINILFYFIGFGVTTKYILLDKIK